MTLTEKLRELAAQWRVQAHQHEQTAQDATQRNLDRQVAYMQALCLRHCAAQLEDTLNNGGD